MELIFEYLLQGAGPVGAILGAAIMFVWNMKQQNSKEHEELREQLHQHATSEAQTLQEIKEGILETNTHLRVMTEVLKSKT